MLQFANPQRDLRLRVFRFRVEVLGLGVEGLPYGLADSEKLYCNVGNC